MQAELIYIWDSVFGVSWHGKDANNYVLISNTDGPKFQKQQL